MSFIGKTYDYEAFSSIGERMYVDKGVNILTLDKTDKPCVYVLVKGVCCLSKLTYEGEEINYLYFSEGQLMRLVSCMLHEQAPPKENFQIITKTACILKQIECSDFKNALRENPDMAEAVIYTLSERLGATLLDQHSAYERPASIRLCDALMKLSVPHKKGFIVEPGFTYAELGKYLKLHQITVSRMMAALKRDKVIRKEKRTIFLDMERLKDIVENQETFKY